MWALGDFKLGCQVSLLLVGLMAKSKQNRFARRFANRVGKASTGLQKSKRYRKTWKEGLLTVRLAADASSAGYVDLDAETLPPPSPLILEYIDSPDSPVDDWHRRPRSERALWLPAMRDSEGID